MDIFVLILLETVDLLFVVKYYVFSVSLIGCVQVMNYLVNHLGHFPMGAGPSILNSLVNENDDVAGKYFN